MLPALAVIVPFITYLPLMINPVLVWLQVIEVLYIVDLHILLLNTEHFLAQINTYGLLLIYEGIEVTIMETQLYLSH